MFNVKLWLRDKASEWEKAADLPFIKNDGQLRAREIEMSGIAVLLRRMVNSRAHLSEEQTENVTDRIRLLAGDFGLMTVTERSNVILKLAMFLNTCAG